MSTPVRRRQSPAVYRRRRLVLLVGVLLVIGLVWLLVAQPWRGNAAPMPATTPSASAPASTPDSATDSATDEPNDGANSDAVDPGTVDGVPTCTAQDVTVEALTDATSYAADQNPQLSIRLTNSSAADCTINVGTTGQSFTITSGNDTWWRSTDCQSEPSDTIVTLTTGQTVTSAAPITWDRTRSSVDTCQDANRVKAPGGGASYHLAVAIGGIAATSTAQFILN
ncbi:hypothetical protein LQ938_01305 [Microbacterium sp. cx-55]|uniref:hypothetical protein n=1 Tax=Microbacterium sp. cx-55 TaxID=2875948 RepID=UPI001CC07B58|nr:hypothetical protein [Microbacterium sp. cx-55]UGB35462.1 hypothetical protein LQ938_01305 [Microbacterium sp. cx-55]